MEIRSFDHIIQPDNFDIIHRVDKHIDEKIVKSTTVSLSNSDKRYKLKFDISEAGPDLDEDDFLYVPETNFLFYRGFHEWCAFDLINKKAQRCETALDLTFIERRHDTIVIYDELSAESTDLEGIRIDEVPLDPPFESVHFDDRIEFNTLTFGKQILKLKR